MIVKLINTFTTDNRKITSIEINKEYEVIGIESDDYRIIDNKNEPILFDHKCFTVVDPMKPKFWLCKTGSENEEYCYPEEWSNPGFFEDYFNRNESVIEKFWEIYNSLYRHM